MGVPIPIFGARPAKQGCPWHGLVVGGTLTLPNTDTKAWAQPTGHGDADVVRAPGQPATSTTAAETAAGMEWRNYYLVSGANRVTDYKITLGAGRWIYVPSAGNAFFLRIVAVVACQGNASGGSINLTIGVRRFAVTGEADAERFFTVTLSGIGQGQWYGVGDITLTPVLESQSESGTKVLISLAHTTTPSVVVGWLLGTVSGTDKAGIGLALSVFKTRAETFTRDTTGSSFSMGSPMGAYSCITESTACELKSGYATNGYISNCTWAAGTPGLNDISQRPDAFTLTVKQRETWIYGGYFSGETPHALSVQWENTYSEIQTGTWTGIQATNIPVQCVGGEQLKEEEWVISSVISQSQHVRVFDGAAEVCKVGFAVDITAEETHNSLSGQSNTWDISGTWTRADAGTEPMSISVGLYTPGLWYVHNEASLQATFDNVTTNWAGETDLYLGAATQAESFYKDAAPTKTNPIDWTAPSNADVPVWFNYGGSGEHAATFRKMGPKSVAVVEQRAGGAVKVKHLVGPGVYAVTETALANWAAQTALRWARQPVTGAANLRTDSVQPGFI